MTDLIACLVSPERTQRLDALRELRASQALPARRGTNVHVHTNHSFSVFRSPAEAAWHAVLAGVEAYGINDFFTTAGYAEFGAACAAVKLPAVFGIECIAIDRELEAIKTLLNDPVNPGKIYLCGKAVTTPDDAEANATLARLRGFQEARNRQLVVHADAHFRASVHAAGPSWQDVASQTPEGNTTERHVAKAILNRLHAVCAENGKPFLEVYRAVVGDAPKANDAEQQNQIRNQLLKSGKPCYSPEDPAAFPAVAEIRALFLQLGAIPTYPVLGNPITGGELDLSAHCDRLERWGFHALELIPARNTDERVTAVLAEAKRREWPVFDGTEHNTPAMEPLTTQWGLDERFRVQLRDGVAVLLGHQALVMQGNDGYVRRDGTRVANGYATCLAAGRALLGQVASAE